MSDKKLRYFAFGGIVVFLFSIIYFVVLIYLSMSNGEKNSQPLFENFVHESNIQSFTSEQSIDQAKNYFEHIKESVDKNSQIGAITISVNSVSLFAYPTTSNFITLNANNEPTLSGSSPMLKTQSASVVNANGQIIILNAISYILQPIDIYNSARVPFLIVLAYTLIILIVLLYNSLTKNQEKENTYTSMYNFDSNDYDIHNATNDDYVEIDAIEKTILINENEEVINSEEVENTEERETIPVVFKEQDNVWDDIIQKKTEMLHDVGETEEIIEQTEPEIETEQETEVENYEETNNIIEEVKQVTDNTPSNTFDPMGLFSDVTGLGWASYLETRLDSELIRSTSSEQDLSLIFLQIKNIHEHINAKKEVAGILLKHFKFRDFVFEYTDDSFAGILTNIDLDQSMAICENLYMDINEYLKAEKLNLKIGIGVSTRSLRILPASRIITESQQALARAFEEKNLPIVAFRVNPDKYRDFITNS